MEHDEGRDYSDYSNDTGDAIDTTFYIENDDMGESSFQFFVVHRLVQLLQYFMDLAGRKAFVAGNQFMHLQKGDERANIAPDVYVIPDVDLPEDAVRSWKLWEHDGRGPCLAVEVVADEAKEARKDYEPEMLAKYQRLGVKELFRYDPYGAGRRLAGTTRSLLTHWVRQEDGTLQEQPLARTGRARSAVFDFWLVHTPPRSLSLGVGPEGEAPFPTREEAAARRAEEEARRAEEQARRAEEQARRADEESSRADEESSRADEQARLVAEQARLVVEQARLATEESRRAEEQARRAEEQARRAEEQARRAEEQARRAEEQARRAATAEQRLHAALAEIERLTRS